MSRTIVSAMALGAAILMGAPSAALAHPVAQPCGCGQSHVFYNEGYTPVVYRKPVTYKTIKVPVYSSRADHAVYLPDYAPYQGYWKGNVYYGHGTRWGTSLDAQLFAASANGDLYAVKQLVQRGAHVDARDQEGLSPLAWAAQYGRTEVAGYLLSQKANLNPADHKGFTPLMWASQEGHQGTVDLLLRHGANPWVVTSYGINALTLARYSGNWRTASLLEDWQWGRRTATATKRTVTPAIPRRISTVPGWAPAQPTVNVVANPGVATLAPAAPALPAAAPNALAAGEPNMIQKALAAKKLTETATIFSDDFLGFTKVQTSGGFSLNTLSAMSSPEMVTGKEMSLFFTNLAKTQDLKAAREDLTRVQATLANNQQSRFLRYITDADAALKTAGF